MSHDTHTLIGTYAVGDGRDEEKDVVGELIGDEVENTLVEQVGQFDAVRGRR